MAVTERMTADEYLRLPEDECPPRTELIAGVLVVHQPLPRHQFIRDDLHVALALWTRATAGRGRVVSPLDVKLDDHNVYAPDLLWYSQSRVPARDGGRPSPLPDLAVELRSPSTWRSDIGTKKSVYEERGLRELWLVDTAADLVLVFRRSKPAATRFDVSLELTAGGTLASPQLPGFSIPVAELFGDDGA